MLGIYIHIPFCISKCRYCDFVSGNYDENIRKQYFYSLENEINHYFSLIGKQKADTVFFGGGTPSSVNPEYIASVMECIFKNTDVSKDSEITIEINPGTLSYDKFEVYRDSGFNRFSVGLQSDDDSLLESIGRIHKFSDFENTMKILDGQNINADMIYALPGQSVKQAEKAAETLAGFHLSHISAYALIPEKGTPLYSDIECGIVVPCDDETDREMYYSVRNILSEHGFLQYEISNFAKKGYECRHNLKYWSGDDYIGFGVAAHSKIGNMRYSNSDDIYRYIACAGLCREVESELSEKDIEQEYIMLRLRLTEGFALNDYRRKFGRQFTDKYRDKIHDLAEYGLVEIEDGYVRLTCRGMDLQNYVLSELIG